MGLLVILFGVTRAALALLEVLPLDATGTAATERRAQREVDVLLRVEAHQEARDVHQLLADTSGGQRNREHKRKDSQLHCRQAFVSGLV